jgi:hypothetical protein
MWGGEVIWEVMQKGSSLESETEKEKNPVKGAVSPASQVGVTPVGSSGGMVWNMSQYCLCEV